MSRCRACRKYNDPYEWPQEELSHYRSDLCYDCYKAKLEQEDQEEEEEANFDPNTEYGMSEVHPEPEDDDTPDLGNEQQDELVEEETTNEEPRQFQDEVKSFQELQRLLFR